MVAEGLGQRPAPKARAEGARRKCWSILARRGARPHRPYVRTYVRRLGPAAHEAPAHHARVQPCAPSQSGGHPLLGGPPTLKEIHHWNRRSFSPGALRVPAFFRSFVRLSPVNCLTRIQYAECVAWAAKSGETRAVHNCSRHASLRLRRGGGGTTIF